ncbi:hypothetical protein [Roseisolibacter sp. H3M3-2]|uniref:hypothetical protein n=1 Tax=Roseisolibacter sp. H3M3-2 TaxID=3031323 RepID=UPI0023DB24D7|nr:hypothetical protein [Roseisolibacter sp. H3M3-2]MDF1505575.1 hypothetical protein [Roseisolibacter sp. H3M3-2]
MTSRTLARDAAAALPLALAACDDGAPLPPESTPVAAQGNTPPATAPARPDSAARPDSTRPDTTRPAGAVAGIRILPRAFVLAPGRVVRVDVQPVDAQGVPSLALLAGPTTLRVDDARVATVDSGRALTGVAAGTTWLHAASGAWRDSVAVSVVVPAPLPAATRLDLPDGTLNVVAGRGLWVGARYVDAQGRPAKGPDARAQWRTSDAAVLRVADTSRAGDSIAVAVVTGVAAGTATLYVEAGALRDSMTVTVAAAPAPGQAPDTTRTPPPAPVARFALTAVVTMPAAGAVGDSARTTAAAGARVSAYRITRDSSGASRDTTGTQTLAASGVADARGLVTLPDLPSGTYRILAEPPEGNTTLLGAGTFLAPPVTAETRVLLHLARKP